MKLDELLIELYKIELESEPYTKEIMNEAIKVIEKLHYATK